MKAGALITLLALSGLVILALVRKETGTEGFLVGLGLAIFPVPLLIAAFRWLDRVEPAPWRNLVFSFAWGACASALIAIIANSFATRWIATRTADPSSADTLGATVVAPVVEETVKAAAILLVFLFRRRDFKGLVDGVVIAGVTATGFAFTENILYLGNAYGTDEATGVDGIGFDSVTAATFFVRIVMSPFAHPLFTVLTGIGFGFAALAADRHRVRRILLPLGGLILAMGMHAAWNGSVSYFGGLGFFLVYLGFMVPSFGLLTWLTIYSRQRELRTVREELPAYVTAGWLTAPEPYALGSLRARRKARQYATQTYGKEAGKDAARAVREYISLATALAFLRARGRSGRAGADFVVRERELLQSLWERRGPARPALDHAARLTAPAFPQPYVPYANPYGPMAGPPGAYIPYIPNQPGYGYPQPPAGTHPASAPHQAYPASALHQAHPASIPPQQHPGAAYNPYAPPANSTGGA
ncbi:PrsW family intramembrane metalloprotease [Streptomyces sp. TRM66268-LWL]|uniref:PrsW family intramembrane metalloprotease n=1 Tax=Streptomyces polyasparticus TaxID=2767826 RepID=A0ABR7SXJ5_9ACTN|nr:PrsW family glutamic-type intramembrane protease [Streptomyces polyasparticus]MBC9719068.1 PrsW family intramembrane metalloprotease [Streptomyces polyasparticus]